MKITKFIKFRYFIISLAIGLFINYITSNAPNIIYVYPTPENVNDIQYKDDGGTCHSFISKQVKCPTDSTKIRSYPVQKGALME